VLIYFDKAFFNLKVLSKSIKVAFNREKLRFYYTNNILNIEDKFWFFSEQDFLIKVE
jgi:DNA replication protein DnaD